MSGQDPAWLCRRHTGQVDLVEGDDNRDTSGFGVADRFFGLRHHAVIGGHHQHGDVGHVGTASSHFGKRFVTRRVDERDFLIAFFDFVGPDVLGDPASFTGDDIDSDQRVQQRRLAVIDVAQERDDRRTRGQRVGIFILDVKLSDHFVFERLELREFQVRRQVAPPTTRPSRRAVGELMFLLDSSPNCLMVSRT